MKPIPPLLLISAIVLPSFAAQRMDKECLRKRYTHRELVVLPVVADSVRLTNCPSLISEFGHSEQFRKTRFVAFFDSVFENEVIAQVNNVAPRGGGLSLSAWASDSSVRIPLEKESFTVPSEGFSFEADMDQSIVLALQSVVITFSNTMVSTKLETLIRYVFWDNAEQKAIAYGTAKIGITDELAQDKWVEQWGKAVRKMAKVVFAKTPFSFTKDSRNGRYLVIGGANAMPDDSNRSAIVIIQGRRSAQSVLGDIGKSMKALRRNWRETPIASNQIDQKIVTRFRIAESGAVTDKELVYSNAVLPELNDTILAALSRSKFRALSGGADTTDVVIPIVVNELPGEAGETGGRAVWLVLSLLLNLLLWPMVLRGI